MEGRTSLVAALTLAVLCGGCTNMFGAKQKDGAPIVGGKSVVPAEPSIPIDNTPKKAKAGPKREASAEFISSLALIAEEAGAKKKKDEPEQFVMSMDKARDLYQKALKAEPNHLKSQEGLVRVYTQLGEHHKAQEVVRKMLDKDPDNVRLWVELGMTHHRQKNLDGALKSFHKALEIEPENRDVRKALGYTLVWSGRVYEGLPHLTAALGKAGAHYNVAGILRQKGMTDEAKRHLQIAVDANPDFERARDMLAALNGGPIPASHQERPDPEASLGFLPNLPID